MGQQALTRWARRITSVISTLARLHTVEAFINKVKARWLARPMHHLMKVKAMSLGWRRSWLLQSRPAQGSAGVVSRDRQRAHLAYPQHVGKTTILDGCREGEVDSTAQKK